MNEASFGRHRGAEFDLILSCDAEVNSVNSSLVDSMFNDSLAQYLRHNGL